MTARLGDGIAKLIILAAALFVLFYASRPITTWDFWWHVKSGEEILEQGSIPSKDSFSHTAGDALWVNHEWLFDVILAPVWAGWGGYPIRAACGLIAVATLLLVVRLGRRWTGSWSLAALLCLAFLGLYFGNIQIRPQILSYPFFLWFFDTYFFRTSKPGIPLLAGTAALIVFWANIHAVALLPVIFYVAYLTAESLSPHLSAGIPILASPSGRLPWKGHLPALAVIFACTFASPNTWRLHEYALKGSSLASTFVNEWAPFYFRYEENRNLPFPIYATVIASLILYGLSLLAHLIRRQRLDGAEVALATTTFYFVLTGRRWLWMAILPMLIALREGSPLRRLAAEALGRRTRSGRGSGALRTAAAAAATLGIAAMLAGPYPRFRPVRQAWDRLREGSYFRLHMNPSVVPAASVNFILNAGLAGNLFNFYGWGGYLLYTLYPGCLVFIDGRAVLFPENVIRDSIAITQRGPEALSLMDRYQVDLTVMPDEWIPPPGSGGRWALLFRNRNEGIYGRVGSENLSRAAAYYAALGIPFGPPDGFVEGAAYESNPAWAEENEILPPELKGELEPLYAGLRQAADPDSAGAQRKQLSSLYLEAGLITSAARELRSVFRDDPADRFAAMNLANVESSLGRPNLARKILQDHLTADPADTQARRMLGRLGGGTLP